MAIRGMMGERLLASYDPEDVLQETLLHAWRDRDGLEWRGVGAFRKWLLEIARHRVCDFADLATTQKRGSGRQRRAADLNTSFGDDVYAGPAGSTTPSRVASDREVARCFEAALLEVPEDSRAVVRIRLFEECEFSEVAEQLGIGVEAVRYRFRHGIEAYRKALRRHRAISGFATSSDS